MRRYDGDHDRRGAVSGQPADAVLVDHDGRVPAQSIAHLDHGARQVDSFFLVERQRGACGEECGEMHIGITTRHHILHDRRKGGSVEPVAVDAAAHAGQRFERRGMRHADSVTHLDAQQGPGRLGQGDLVERNQVFAFDLEKRGLDFPPACGDEDLRARGKAFRTADMAVGAHDDDWLMLRVQAKPSRAQDGLFGSGRSRVGRRHRSNTWS